MHIPQGRDGTTGCWSHGSAKSRLLWLSDDNDGGEQTMGLVIAIVVAGTSIWVAIDASHLEVKRGCLGGGFADSGPVGWFFCTLLLWIIGFPAYLITRPKYVERRRALAAAAPTGTPGAPSVLSGAQDGKS
jgi:hypothetical protein